MRRRSGLVALAFAAACSDGPSERVPSIVVVAPDGSNPVVGRSLEWARATFQVERTGQVATIVEAPIVDDSFDLAFPVRDRDLPMHVELELTNALGTAIVGASPSFFVDGTDSVSIVVGPRGTCAVVPSLALATPRDHLAATRLGSHVLVVGGNDAGGASSAIEVFDLVSLARLDVSLSIGALGPSRLAPLDRTQAVVTSDGVGPTFLRILSNGDVVEVGGPSLHAGAADPDGLTTFIGRGALFVGGGDDAMPTPTMSFVFDSLESATMDLPVAFPSAAAGSSTIGAYVYANDDAEGRLFQVQSTTGPVIPREDTTTDGVRRGPSLFVSDSGTGLLVFGGTDAGDVVRDDTLSITQCPTGCFLAPGPDWTNARAGVAYDPEGGVLAGGEGPSAIVERARADAASASIVPFATLVHPRSDAATVSLPGGVALVFGGHDGASFVAETEICFPP